MLIAGSCFSLLLNALLDTLAEKLTLLTHSVLVMFVAFEVYGNRITTISQIVDESSQKYHKWHSTPYDFVEMNRNNTEHHVSAKRGSRWVTPSLTKTDFPSPRKGKGSQSADWQVILRGSSASDQSPGAYADDYAASGYTDDEPQANL